MGEQRVERWRNKVDWANNWACKDRQMRRGVQAMVKVWRAWVELTEYIRRNETEVESWKNVRHQAKVDAQNAQLEQERRLFDVLAFVKANRRAQSTFPITGPRSP